MCCDWWYTSGGGNVELQPEDYTAGKMPQPKPFAPSRSIKFPPSEIFCVRVGNCVFLNLKQVPHSFSVTSNRSQQKL